MGIAGAHWIKITAFHVFLQKSAPLFFGGVQIKQIADCPSHGVKKTSNNLILQSTGLSFCSLLLQRPNKNDHQIKRFSVSETRNEAENDPPVFFRPILMMAPNNCTSYKNTRYYVAFIDWHGCSTPTDTITIYDSAERQEIPQIFVDHHLILYETSHQSLLPCWKNLVKISYGERCLEFHQSWPTTYFRPSCSFTFCLQNQKTVTLRKFRRNRRVLPWYVQRWYCRPSPLLNLLTRYLNTQTSRYRPEMDTSLLYPFLKVENQSFTSVQKHIKEALKT